MQHIIWLSFFVSLSFLEEKVPTLHKNVRIAQNALKKSNYHLATNVVVGLAFFYVL